MNRYESSASKDRVDYTGKFGSLFPETDSEWPMYSFERPAWLFWNGVANYLRSTGLDDAQIKERLASKDMRWMLDHGPICETQVEQLGFDAAQAYYRGGNK